MRADITFLLGGEVMDGVGVKDGGWESVVVLEKGRIFGVFDIY